VIIPFEMICVDHWRVFFAQQEKYRPRPILLGKNSWVFNADCMNTCRYNYQDLALYSWATITARACRLEVLRVGKNGARFTNARLRGVLSPQGDTNHARHQAYRRAVLFHACQRAPYVRCAYSGITSTTSCTGWK
jgi:hypothetical protein